jgi:glycosyltransferase involved in cell wall biosynthesis
MSARRFRAQLPALLRERSATALLSPWSAFPDLVQLGMPVVAVVHELPFVRHGALEGRLRAWKHRYWLHRNVRSCAAIVTPTQATRADVLTLHPEAADRVHVVPNGFDPEPWQAARRAPDDPPYVVMVGIGANRRMARKKGLDVALAVWREGRARADLRLVLVGEPALPLVGGVEARPKMPDDRLRDLVAGARALLYPSRSEGFGYPPLESLAAGVPVVASDVPAVAEVVGDAAVLVPPGDAAALAAGIERALTDAARTEARAAERAAVFAPEHAAAGMRAVFRAVGVPA